MLQLAIWGIAMMLVVKGLDVLHRDAVAAKAGHGSPAFAYTTTIVAILGAAALVFLSDEQVKQTPSFNPPPFDLNVN